jgi:hypothetical protein
MLKEILFISMKGFAMKFKSIGQVIIFCNDSLSFGETIDNSNQKLKLAINANTFFERYVKVESFEFISS